MIVFEGRIKDEAFDRFLEKTRTYEQNLLLFAFTLAFLLMLPVALSIQAPMIVFGGYPIIVGVILIGVRVPKSEKEKNTITPKKIYIEDDVVVCVTNKQTERRLVKDVKEVLDCKTYYELVFKVGKLSANYICQKDLLVRGTIKEFETLFEGKITDMTSYFE